MKWLKEKMGSKGKDRNGGIPCEIVGFHNRLTKFFRLLGHYGT